MTTHRIRRRAHQVCLPALILLTCLFLLPPASAQNGYHFTTVDVPGEAGTSAYGLNDVGLFPASTLTPTPTRTDSSGATARSISSIIRVRKKPRWATAATSAS
jgi:hypothetical protein